MKKRIVIQLLDIRGTSLRLALFLHPLQIPEKVRELAGIWENAYGGNADAVVIDDCTYSLDQFECALSGDVHRVA